MFRFRWQVMHNAKLLGDCVVEELIDLLSAGMRGQCQTKLLRVDVQT